MGDHQVAALDVEAEALAALLVLEHETAGPQAHEVGRVAGQQAEAVAALGSEPGLRAWPSDGLPRALRSHFQGRTGHVVVLADPPRLVEPPREGPLLAAVRRLLGRARGVHGYDPTQPEMGAIFYAMGRGVPANLELGAVHATQLAPTASALRKAFRRSPRDDRRLRHAKKTMTIMTSAPMPWIAILIMPLCRGPVFEFLCQIILDQDKIEYLQ